jgi:ribulose-5-phosphate 4-epimerase/fuculose-1-phosphate aldolase
VGHQIAQHGLVICSSGNLSCRVDNEHILITATGAWLSELTKDEVTLCRISDGTSLTKKKPSMELGFHKGILSVREDVNVVLHFASPSATTLACSKNLTADCFSVIPEIPYYIGPVAIVPYFAPGSADLAAAVTAAIREHDLVILQNHGQVRWSRLPDALRKALYFEFASSIYLGAAIICKPLEGTCRGILPPENGQSAQVRPTKMGKFSCNQ